MKFGVSTFLWKSPFTSHSFDLVHKIKGMGFDIIEVAVEQQELIATPMICIFVPIRI